MGLSETNLSLRKFCMEISVGTWNLTVFSSNYVCSGFVSLWTDYTEVIYSDVPSLSTIQSINKTSCRDKFLMKLRLEFENVRCNLMSQVSSPSLDTCLNQLLYEESRACTENSRRAHATRSKPQARNMSKFQCYNCQKFGHLATKCK